MLTVLPDVMALQNVNQTPHVLMIPSVIVKQVNVQMLVLLLDVVQTRNAFQEDIKDTVVVETDLLETPTIRFMDANHVSIAYNTFEIISLSNISFTI
jgi:hypothetical protein